MKEKFKKYTFIIIITIVIIKRKKSKKKAYSVHVASSNGKKQVSRGQWRSGRVYTIAIGNRLMGPVFGFRIKNM